jgi:hypothetical protein
MKKVKFCEYGPRSLLGWGLGGWGGDTEAEYKTFHFLIKLLMDPIRQCYITLGWKALPLTNPLVYWAHS